MTSNGVGLLIAGSVILFTASMMPTVAQTKSNKDEDRTTSICSNRALGDQSLSPAKRQHRVALGGWPIGYGVEKCDTRVSSWSALLEHLASSGYDGVEMGMYELVKYYFPNLKKENWMEKASQLKKEAHANGIQIFGAIYHITDGDSLGPNTCGLDFSDSSWEEQLSELISYDMELGSEYATFQIDLPPRYKYTGGLYRDDQKYLELCAERVNKIQTVCFNSGVNFYVETHVDRISEDPSAMCKIMEISRQKYQPFELNGDLSHYIYRNNIHGKDINLILDNIGHTHQRMANEYGDLSVNVPDPKHDWETHGVTYKAFAMSKRAFKNGLSSRVIVGESGPLHSVSDPLTVDVSLIPLYRYMAKYANEEISPANPF